MNQMKIIEQRNTISEILKTCWMDLVGEDDRIESVNLRTDPVWQFFTKLNIHLPYDWASPLLGIYPKKGKFMCDSKTCTQVFTAALSVIARS